MASPAPDCIRGCGASATPIVDAKGDRTTDGWNVVEGDTQIANVWCPCCGYGWRADAETLRAATVAYEEWQTEEIEREHGRNPRWSLRTTRDEVTAAAKLLSPQAQYVVQTAKRMGARFGMWRYGRGNLARPAVVVTKPSPEVEASLALAGFVCVQTPRGFRYEWKGQTT